jgi:RNA polymerase sigma-70 factor (ECF subfamily)
VASADELVASFATGWAGTMPPAIGAVLVERCATARAAHPGLAIDEGGLVAVLASHVPAGADPLAFVTRCRIAELALAHAAAAGSSAAIAALERTFAAPIGVVCRRFVVPGHALDDLHQIVRAKLFVAAPDQPAAIARYNGQGSLESWVRVIAVRELIDLGRRRDRMREHAIDEPEVIDAADLALDLVKAEYRDAVFRALHEAARRLAPGDRHLLRQHLVAGLSIDQLAAVLGVHRATAARRIARARDLFGATTREVLAARLRLDDRELAEILGLVTSKLDFSIARLLASLNSPPPGGDPA